MHVAINIAHAFAHAFKIAHVPFESDAGMCTQHAHIYRPIATMSCISILVAKLIALALANITRPRRYQLRPQYTAAAWVRLLALMI